MDITVLKNLLRIANAESLTVAAQASHLTLQALAAQLKKAEAHFGFALFHRTHKGVALTPQGQQLMPYIAQVVQCAGQLDQHALTLRQQQRPQLHIALNATFPGSISQKIIRFLTARLPGYTLLFSTAETPENLQKLALGDADMAIVLGDNVPGYYPLALPGLDIQVVAARAHARECPPAALIRPLPACAYAACFARFTAARYPGDPVPQIPSGGEQVTVSLLHSMDAVGIVSLDTARANNLHVLPGFSYQISATLLMKNILITQSDIQELNIN